MKPLLTIRRTFFLITSIRQILSVNNEIQSQFQSNINSFFFSAFFQTNLVLLSVFSRMDNVSDRWRPSLSSSQHHRTGYPPITPLACVRDSIASATFDYTWTEVNFTVHTHKTIAIERFLKKSYDANKRKWLLFVFLPNLSPFVMTDVSILFSSMKETSKIHFRSAKLKDIFLKSNHKLCGSILLLGDNYRSCI